MCIRDRGIGPRDLQKKQSLSHIPPSAVEAELVKKLTEQVGVLTAELARRPAVESAAGQPSGGKTYSAEEFDEELIKQIKQAIKETEKEFKNEIKSLKAELKTKDDIVKAKDETIHILKLKAVREDEVFVEDPDRPEMEDVFIDPSSKEDGKNMKSYITLESKEDDNIGDKVNKLKSLIGGLPK